MSLAFRALLVPLALVAMPFLAGCSSGSTSSAPPASQIVGADGGRLVVTAGVLAGTSLDIPAGAVGKDVRVSILSGVAKPSPGYGAIGPAAKIGPEGIEFVGGATLVLPYEAAIATPSTPLQEFVVKAWDGVEVFDLPVLGVDRIGGHVTVRILTGGTAWVALFGRAAPTPLRDYWPMADGDRYDFDNSAVLRMIDSDPVLTGQVRRTTELAWSDGVKNWGHKWLIEGNGDLYWLGQYGMSGDDRRLAYDPQLLCPKLMKVGTRVERSFPFRYFRGAGSGTGTFFGDESTLFEVEAQLAELSVPLGTFRDVLRVRLHSNVGLGVRVDSTVFWLARNVGPIQVQVNTETAMRLVGGWVGGVRILSR